MTATTTTETEVGSQTRIQSVSRGIRILFAIASSEDGLTVKEVAAKFELSTPTAYHLINTLVYEGIVVKDERRRYLLGPAASIISEGFARTNPIPDRYLEAVQRLASVSGETAYLSGWRNGAIAVLSAVEGSQAVRVAGLSTGYSDNLHARASGKLLLAFAPEALREAVLDRTVLRRMTPQTIVSRTGLYKEFERIREADVAFDREEFHPGVECVSAPIREGGVVTASLTLSCPAERFRQREPELVELIHSIASEASRSS